MDKQVLALTDLSMVELVALQILNRKQEGLKRHHLYLEVTQFFDGKKQLATSSFYNTINKLLGLGLIQELDTEGSQPLIFKTPDLGSQLEQVTELLVSSGYDMTEVEINFIAEIEKRISLRSFGETLVIDSSNYLDLQLMHYLQQRSSAISVLSLGPSSTRHLQMELIDTELRDDKIREPGDTFDVCIIPVYFRDLDQLDKQQFLEEIIRVLKPGGVLVVTAFAPFPLTDNFFANQVLEKYNSLLGERMVSEELLSTDFDSLSTQRYDIFDYKGMMIGILWK